MSAEQRDHTADMQYRAAAYWSQAVASGRTIQATEAHARPPGPRRYWTVQGHEAVVTSIEVDGRLHDHVPGHLAETSWDRDGHSSQARNFDLHIQHSLDQGAAQDVTAGHHRQASLDKDQGGGLDL